MLFAQGVCTISSRGTRNQFSVMIRVPGHPPSIASLMPMRKIPTCRISCQCGPLNLGIYCGPEQAQQPELTLNWRSGSAVDMALLLASLLLGQGRDVHVVLGTCPRHASGGASAIPASATWFHRSP